MTSLIDAYRHLLDISRQMQEAAQSKNWDRAVALEGSRTELLKKIQSYPDISTLDLDVQERLEITGLIKDILQCDAQFAPLVSAEMTELRELMNSVANERRLGQSYL